ncbi:MAG TPA: SRPBCC family protein [Acidimicrobiia bacterium]|nr:SRPBCC family protein [Acidimicrobiia bacterium]
MGTLSKQGRVEAVADAPVDAVWNVLVDLTRTGEWSHECQGVEWLGGATHAEPGARFRGRNHQGRSKWSRQCEITVVDNQRALTWRTIPTAIYRDSTDWSITLEPIDDGVRTRITQTYHVTKIGPVMDRLFYWIVPAHRDRLAALTEDMKRLGAIAEVESRSQRA